MNRLKVRKLIRHTPGICSKLLRLDGKIVPAVTYSSNYSIRQNSGLVNELTNQIKATGPITFADYMKQALSHPIYGYYMNRDVFGRKGDFITSPEISQIFGELICIWCLDTWYRLGRPKPLHLVELGPGRGTLANDILRVLNSYHFIKKEDISMHLVEMSPHLSQMQMDTLCGEGGKWQSDSDVCYSATSKYGFKCSWYRNLQQVPQHFSIYIAHEFFDAMPVHKLQKRNGEWREVLVDIEDGKFDNFRFVLSRGVTPASILFSQKGKDNWNSNDAEFSPETAVLLSQLTTRVVKNGGVIVIADYGHQGEKGDTVRAFKQHKLLTNPLESPGDVDVTADVNFLFLRQVAEKHEGLCFGPVTQRDFLSSMGIQLRLEQLLKATRSPEEREQLKSGCSMLCDVDKMGERFHFMSIFPDVMKSYLQTHPPAGFQNQSTL
ncbi:hypothetical protein CHUAL_009698 [Chamberlinius hualienensis]